MMTASVPKFGAPAVASGPSECAPPTRSGRAPRPSYAAVVRGPPGSGAGFPPCPALLGQQQTGAVGELLGGVGKGPDVLDQEIPEHRADRADLVLRAKQGLLDLAGLSVALGLAGASAATGLRRRKKRPNVQE